MTHYNIDLKKLDKTELALDIAGIAGDAALVFTSEPGVILEGIVSVVELASFGKATYDAIGGDIQNLNVELITEVIEKNPVIVARAGRWVPLIGSIGSAYSLYDNISNSVIINTTVEYRR